MSQENAIVSGEVTLILAGLPHMQVLGPHGCHPLDGSLIIPVTSKVLLSLGNSTSRHSPNRRVGACERTCVQGYSLPHGQSGALESTGWWGGDEIGHHASGRNVPPFFHNDLHARCGDVCMCSGRPARRQGSALPRGVDHSAVAWPTPLTAPDCQGPGSGTSAFVCSHS